MSAHVRPTAELPVVVTQRCACGGYVTADPRRPFRAVMRHNVTIEHLGWWAREETELETDRPGVPARADTSRRAITRAREEER